MLNASYQESVMLTCRLDSRIFQGKMVQDLVGEVFAGFGSLAKYDFSLNKSKGVMDS